MKNFKGNSPKNARIKINYSGKKPKVKFSYPDQKNQTEGTMLWTIYLFWAIFVFLSYSIVGTGLDYFDKFDTRDAAVNKCVKDFNDYNFTRVINSVCSPEKFIFVSELSAQNKYQELKIKLSKSYIIQRLAFIFFVLIPPLLIYFPFRKFWSNVYPNWNALIARKKYRKFRPKDVQKDKDGNYFCEIPLFQNVLLDYIATKDFSKYLEFFEIREFKFSHYKRSQFDKNIKKGKKKKKKRKVNEYLWYAKFYFKKQIKTGQLEVIFK